MIRHCAEDLEVGVQILAKCHNRGYVATPVAVIWGRPHSDHILGGEVILVAFIYELMCSSDEVDAVDVIELSQTQSVSISSHLHEF